ncbi:hypothetical protein EDC02_6488 [Micromonospora sp. Llam0]|uniref:hypothetical protein n=1 Tax=Micromonospora sp. Llam0 TaxID=2485143 RepID=UPI000F9C00B4|nr:hypothetical protein [Micromonospora sp. Llam0]ROO51605.1 hypothetical protein EDC02_6488 [Micromonospora sp. Llam0]
MGRRNRDADRDAEWAGDEGQAFVDDLEQRSAYRQEILDDVVAPPTDPVREVKERDLDDPADVPIPAETLRDGGPTRSGGGLTTTGGTAGPASTRRVNDSNRDTGPGRGRSRGKRGRGKVAPTTTGDATSGGMGTPAGGTTSDATTREA